jgi:NDP-sugar pyrophosphorylase family protein
MLIIGSSGFAKEILEIFHQKDDLKDVRFFDDVNTNIEDKLYGQFPILKEESKVKEYFEKVSRYFVIGIGNPPLRHKMYKKFLKLGGLCNGVYSSKANIGNYDVNIGEGVIIMDGVNISNSVFIGKGTMIYYNSNITHDCIIGEFVEISPSVNILGRVKVGNFVR